MTIKLLVVDDQALVRRAFVAMLSVEDDLVVVGDAADGLEAVERARRLRPDVVLMDIRMPNVDGVEATRRVRALPDPPKVLVLTTFDLDEYVFEALRAGASGFLLKDVPPEELVHAIGVVAAGEALLAPSVTRRLIAEFAARTSAGASSPAPGLDQLTEREAEVLRLMARGMSNAEIAAHLYLGETTVKTHVGRILAKLGARDRVQAVVIAYESGVVTPGDI